MAVTSTVVPPAADVPSIDAPARPGRRPRSAAPGRWHRSRSRCAPRRTRPRRRTARAAPPTRPRRVTTLGVVQVGRGRRRPRRTWPRTPRSWRGRCGARSTRTTPHPRTRSSRRCPARPRIRRAGRRARQVLADRADQILDRGLAVRGPQQSGPVGRQRPHRLGPDLGRSASRTGRRWAAGRRESAGWSRRPILPSSIRSDCQTGACSDLSGERVDYLGDHLLESAAPADPFDLFDAWLADAFAAKDDGRAARAHRDGGGHLRRGPPERAYGAAEERSAGRDSSSSPTTTRARATRSPQSRRSRCTSAGIRCIARCGSRASPSGSAARSRRPTSRTRPRGSQLGAWASAQSTRGRLAGGADRVVRGRRAALRRAGGALPRTLGRLSGHRRADRVLAGPAQPDARSAGLPAYRFGWS